MFNPKLFTFKEKKLFVFSWLLILFLQILFYFLFYYQKPFRLFPNYEKDFFTITFFNDSVDEGTSKIIQKSILKDSVSAKMILGDGFKYAYCGFDFTINHENGINVSKYNRINVVLSTTEEISHLFIYLNTLENAVKNKSHRLAIRRNVSDLLVTTKQKNKFILSIKNFHTPNWWFEQLDLNKKDVGSPDWKRLKNIAITTGVNTSLNKLVGFTLYEITFFRDNSEVLRKMAFLQLFLAFLLFSYANLGIKQKIEINYKPVETLEKVYNEEKILKYISLNYHNPNLSLSEISKNCGINKRYISEIIQGKTGLSFKQYVNKLRISEAKRLLKETNLPFNEIGYKVGFNSPSNFNRVFKNQVGKSPSEFIKEISSESQ